MKIPSDPRCIVCCSRERELTRGHVIPQAIGGRLHALFECRPCNSLLGHEVERDVRQHAGDRLALEGLKGSVPRLSQRLDENRQFFIEGPDARSERRDLSISAHDRDAGAADCVLRLSGCRGMVLVWPSRSTIVAKRAPAHFPLEDAGVNPAGSVVSFWGWIWRPTPSSEQSRHSPQGAASGSAVLRDQVLAPDDEGDRKGRLGGGSLDDRE